MKRFLNAWIAIAAFAGAPLAVSAVSLDQIVSREDPRFICRRASLTIGRDGRVYLCNNDNTNAGFMLRMTPEGKEKVGSEAGAMARNVAANANGVIAVANVHFGHKVSLYDSGFRPIGELAEFLAGDQVGWNAPGHVEAGASGDFYAVDQHRDRIVQVGPTGKLIRTYPIPHDPEGPGGLVQDFRVCEKTQAFILLPRTGPLRCVGFDGKLRWKAGAAIGWGEFANAGGYDVDDNGVLYTIEARAGTVRRFSPDGQPLDDIELQMDDDLKEDLAEHVITDLRVRGNDLLLHRAHDAEMFQRYDLAGGAFKQAVFTSHERLSVTFPSEVWTAGRKVPFEIKFDDGGRSVKPRWRIWMRPFDSLDYRELILRDGAVEAPADCAGVHQVKVTPEVRPWQRGDPSELLVSGWIEIRSPDARGSATVLTDGNRAAFGRGETIPFSVAVRATGTHVPEKLSVNLVDGTNILATAQVALPSGKKEAKLVLPRSLTEQLRPGSYALTVSAAGLTGVPRQLAIGRGIEPSPFRRIDYGDYYELYPTRARLRDVADVASAYASRMAKIGMNLMVDRIGLQTGAFQWSSLDAVEIEALRKRLESSPLAADPRSVLVPSPLPHTLSAYGAEGIQQMAILMGNDAGLPLGAPGFDHRKPDQILEDLKRITRTCLPFPAFRGWVWSSNWWLYEKRGSAAARTPSEKTAYEAALARADDKGSWDPVIETVSNIRLGFAVEAQALFDKTLRGIATNLVSASACPFRNVESYPPITLGNVDEVDLQAQWEQIAVPYASAFAVDFYKRPGKPAWSHPEIWNDAGTGDQILPATFQAVMRGADGVGCSGHIPPWQRAVPPIREDSRISRNGTVSIYRAMNDLLAQYGPWFTTLRNNDAVAIPVSGRMFRIDRWSGVMGIHFARVMEAWTSCLHAHHPASLVFAEDLTPASLKRFKAIVVVGQRVEMEPALANALTAARASGAAIFYDGTCRESLVKDYRPLGVSFDKFERDHHCASDDAAYWRLPAYCRANAPAIRKALGEVVAPCADTGNDEVFFSERTSEDGRYFFVVNNTTPGIDPGMMWRMTLCVATRVPLIAPVKLPAEGKAVYDVFALRKIEAKGGTVAADLRTLPVRIYAVLPESIEQVEVRGPSSVGLGRNFNWSAQVQDRKGKPIRAGIPIRVRLTASDGTVLEERFVAAGSKGANGTLPLPLNSPAGDPTLEVTELLSGKTAALQLKAAPPEGAITIAESEVPRKAALPPANRKSTAKPAHASAPRPAEENFGPHIRDIALIDGGALAVMNTMNWDHNLYALDTGAGKLRWRQRVGHYFAFEPQATRNGFAAQGFDFRSAEGYHLYLGDANGRIERRFALYGLPHRLIQRFVPSILKDDINNFAIPGSGNWIASAGDLGLAVWQRDGKPLWSQDWWKTKRREARLAALDEKTLLVVEGMKATAYAATTGATQWQLELALRGEVRRVRISRDGTTCALLATTEGGRVFVLRNGKLLRALPGGGDDLAISSDGTRIAVVEENQLKLYSLKDGLQWILPADDALHFPRFSPDDQRIAACSDLGSLYVTDIDGKMLLDRDVGALAVPAWLPNGDLLFGTWMGRVCRLGPDYRERWNTRLQPEAEDMREKLLADDGAPTTRIASWGNADPSPAPIAPNLLSPGKCTVKFIGAQPHIQFARDPSAMMDGKPDAPADPWLDWTTVGRFAEMSPFNHIQIDTLNTRMRVTGITLFEDPAHPESWLRDVGLEYWDAEKERWTLAEQLFSDAATHTHKLSRPVESSRLRLVTPWGLCGNLRLAEIVLHGEPIGTAHPDAFNKRPVAVLFDEGDDLKDSLVATHNGASYKFEDPHAGGRCIAVSANAHAAPLFISHVGHLIPHWDFEIAEKPAPGQYRYLQFAWRALSPETMGITLHVGGGGHGQTLGLHAGEYSTVDGEKAVPVAAEPPREWKVVRVDLWELFNRDEPPRIKAMRLSARGGSAAFDRILLGRTEADLPPAGK